jgi:hypothetical protein
MSSTSQSKRLSPGSSSASPKTAMLEGYELEAAMAEEFGESERTWQRRRYGRMGPPFILVGRRVYYRRAAVEKWLTSRERDFSDKQPARRRRA